MNTFSLSDPARLEIQRILQSSGCKDPVITLSDIGPVNLPDSTKAELLEGVNDVKLEAIRELLEKQVRQNQQSGIVVATAYERSQCASKDLTEISGLPFAMTAPMREALRDYALIYVAGEFMLQSSEETVPNLRSVKTLAEWFK